MYTPFIVKMFTKLIYVKSCFFFLFFSISVANLTNQAMLSGVSTFFSSGKHCQIVISVLKLEKVPFFYDNTFLPVQSYVHCMFLKTRNTAHFRPSGDKENILVAVKIGEKRKEALYLKTMKISMISDKHYLVTV